MAGLVDNGIETVVMISGIMDSAKSAIRFSYSVRSLHNIPVTFLLMRLEISGMVVFNPVFVLVFGVRLKLKNGLVLVLNGV